MELAASDAGVQNHPAGRLNHDEYIGCPVAFLANLRWDETDKQMSSPREIVDGMRLDELSGRTWTVIDCGEQEPSPAAEARRTGMLACLAWLLEPVQWQGPEA